MTQVQTTLVALAGLVRICLKWLVKEIPTTLVINCIFALMGIQTRQGEACLYGNY